MKVKGHYVRMTAPLALAHARRTWSSVAPNLSAIFLRGSSTGPPRRDVTGLFLKKGDKYGYFNRFTKLKGNSCKMS